MYNKVTVTLSVTRFWFIANILVALPLLAAAASESVRKTTGFALPKNHFSSSNGPSLSRGEYGLVGRFDAKDPFNPPTPKKPPPRRCIPCTPAFVKKHLPLCCPIHSLPKNHFSSPNGEYGLGRFDARDPYNPPTPKKPPPRRCTPCTPAFVMKRLPLCCPDLASATSYWVV